MPRVALALYLVVLLLIQSGEAVAAAQDNPLVRPELDRDRNDTSVSTLDLSAMMLTPHDLADLGFDGFQVRNSFTDTLDDEFLTYIAHEDDHRSVRALLEEAGFVQSRWALLDLPSEDDPDLPAVRITVYIDEYREPEPLPDVLDVYLNVVDGEDVEGTETIGDESRIVTNVTVASDTDVDITSMIIGFIYEDQIGQIEIADYATQTPDIDLEVEDVEALANRLLENMIAVREEGSADLGTMVLRYESDGSMVYYVTDCYTRYDDEPVAQSNLDEDAASDLDDAERAYGISDAYSLYQVIGHTGNVAVLWNVQIRRFDDEDDVEEWLDEADDWLEMTGLDDVEILDDDLDLGDGAVALAATPPGSFQTTSVFVQIDDLGVLVQLSTPDEAPDLDLVMELAAMQLECVTDGCPVESSVPDELIDLAESL